MSDIKFWDPVDVNNQSAAPDGWPEGQPAGTINDCGRAVQGAVRRQWEEAAWFDFNDSATFVSSTSLDLAGTDLAGRYHVGRRVRVTGTLTGTVYGTITNVAGDYVITVALDSGAFAADPDLAISVGAPADNPSVDVQGVANLVFPVAVPIGSGMDWWGAAVPDATWLFADGAAVSRTTYAQLFAVMGTTYGAGDGSTTFNLPDMRGRVAAGKDDMGGAAAGRLTNPTAQATGVNGAGLGNFGGAEAHTMDVPEMPSHTHTQLGGGNNAQAGTGRNSMSGSTSIQATAATGGGGAHNNVQPTLICNYIIKALA